MNVKTGVVAAVLALSSVPAMVEPVVAEVGDTTVGSGLGLSTGLMLGGAAGGLEERTCQVRDGKGERDIVRSPTAQFAIGDQIERCGNRLYAVP